MSLISAVLHEADKISLEDYKKNRDELLTKVKDLQERMQMLSWALHQNIIDTYLNFVPTKSLEQLNYKNRKHNILADYDKLVTEVKTFNEKFIKMDSKDEFSNSYKLFDTAYINFLDLCTVVEGKIILDKANHEFGRNNYTEAVISVKNLQKNLHCLTFDGNAKKALNNVISQCENQLSMYLAQLSVEWEDIFVWKETKEPFYMTYSLSVQQNDSQLIQKILKSLYVTDRLNAELGLFSNFFIRNLLHNVIRHNCDIFTEDHIGALEFNIKIDLNDKKKPNFNTIFNNLTAIFEFLHSTLGSHFECDKTFIEVFAESINNKFFNKIIEDCIRNNLPSCDSSYENYKNIVVELDSFNKFLIDLKFVAAEKSPLNKFVSDTECVLYDKRCDKLLFDIRNLLKQSLSHGIVSVGQEIDIQNESMYDDTQKDILNSPLHLPKCVISENVKEIMSMIIKHLEESIKLPEKYGEQLVLYIKDIAVNYQCIVPKKFKINLECCPLDIALFFNNCFYLAHSLLGPPWKNVLPARLANYLTTTLLECVQDLRAVGLQKISLYLQNQKNVIIQEVEANELPWSQNSFEVLDGAVNHAISLMRELKDCWNSVLPLKMYELSMCTLAQALCQSMLQRMFADTKPICEELVYMLAIRFEDTVDDILFLFEKSVKLEMKINCWNKFIKMPQLLKAQLLEITDLWKHDTDLNRSYTCEEIRSITAFLITALAIVVNQRVVNAQTSVFEDLLAIETKNNALTVINGPKILKPPTGLTSISNQTFIPEPRPPSKPPINLSPDKKYFYDLPPQFFNPAKKLQAPPVHVYTKEPLKLSNSVYKFPNVVSMQHGNKIQAPQYSPTINRPPVYSPTSGKTSIINSPKFSLPIQTINGIRTDFVKPPPFINITTTSTTTPTTTTRLLRTKRIWPKRMLEKNNSTSLNSSATNDFLKNNVSNITDLAVSSSRVRVRYASTEKPITSTSSQSTTRGYRRVTRAPKANVTTQASKIEPNDWIPIVPHQYTKRKPLRTRISKRSIDRSDKERSDVYFDNQGEYTDNKNVLYLQPYGILPMNNHLQGGAAAIGNRMVFFRKKKQTNLNNQEQSSILNPFAYASQQSPKFASFAETAQTRLKNLLNPLAYATEQQPKVLLNPFAYSLDNNPKTVLNPYAAEPTEQRPKIIYRGHKKSKSRLPLQSTGYEDQRQEASHHAKVVTKIKHHHHHHHHRYIKTVEKPVNVPVKVEVPKPYPVEKQVPVPVPVEKIKIVDRPYPVTVEKKVPYPVAVKVPHPVPYKVVEKEYVPRPYPVIQHVPVVKHVEVKVPQPVPVEVEKRVPVPVQVAVPVEKQVPYPVEVEKRVPYPVPVKVYVPQPYAVEKRVPYPVEVKVKEPVEVIKHVEVKVPVPQPYPVKVPHPVRVEVEKRVPYPVQVEKRVPVPYEVLVPQKVEVEKRVPVYVPKPYPVEKKVPYPVRVPYPVKVPVEVPVEVPVYIHHPFQIINDDVLVGGASEHEYSENQVIDRSTDGQSAATPPPDNSSTSIPHHAVTVHGNTGYNSISSRSDSTSATTPAQSSIN
ncbi:uncharacterized protein LOC121726383 [Aricia agestis]|uniref:uncharacterized protein LOC121726383 n=1 Tax=Aricia agestis TaxID=91739 RepID=UPI001C208F21|nr:uncharacterized protein LOC121726383 [Aricia agestis]